MRLIDADAVYNKAVEDQRKGEIEDWEADSIIDYLDDAPTINDAEIVVRCKGCKHSTLPSELTQRYGVPGTLTCHNRYSPCNRRNVGGEDFCSYGERKEDSPCES